MGPCEIPVIPGDVGIVECKFSIKFGNLIRIVRSLPPLGVRGYWNEHNFVKKLPVWRGRTEAHCEKIDDGLKCTAIRFILSGMDCSGIFIGGLDLS